MDLRTRYLGLELANPLVPSASPLSRDLDMARRLEDAGAAALVMYSLFEEELHPTLLPPHEFGHVEAQSYLPLPAHPAAALDSYLEQIAALKRRLQIPVIASLNGSSRNGWVECGRELVEAGADALELNLYTIAAEVETDSQQQEQHYLALLAQLRGVVTVPITVKLSPYFTALANMVASLEAAGANGVALFNRFYQPDIDTGTLRLTPRLQLSHPGDTLLAMRWLGILHGKVGLSLAATGGIHSAEDAIKMLLAGADVTHLCSALLRHGPRHLSEILRGMEQWLAESPYESLEMLKGSLAHRHAGTDSAYERASYVRMLGSYALNPTQWE
ncbi:MAG: dihydroorotate dehydrogenase-like protein [Gammaproteobacteria bacterium]|nr:dihydroorotate dehydrogenase-like protein [Gammaproteobacteria bacterium]